MTTKNNNSTVSKIAPYISLLTGASIIFALSTDFFDRGSDSGVSKERLDKVVEELDEVQKELKEIRDRVTTNQITLEFLRRDMLTRKE